MDWETIGGLVNQVTGKKNEGDEEGAENNQAENSGGGLLGLVSSALGGGNKQQLIGQLLGNLTSIGSDQRAGVVGSLLSGLGASGVNVQSLLNQLGINPEVADNPEAASHEDLEKLAAHVQENAGSEETAEASTADATADDAVNADATTDDSAQASATDEADSTESAEPDHSDDK